MFWNATHELTIPKHPDLELSGDVIRAMESNCITQQNTCTNKLSLKFQAECDSACSKSQAFFHW